MLTFSKGTAVVMQGRYIEHQALKTKHQALKTVGGSEKITMITPFRPRDPVAKDESVLTTVRAISHLGELYTSYTEYRFKVLQSRFTSKMAGVQKRLAVDDSFDVDDMHRFLGEQQLYLQTMIDEIRNLED